MMRIKNHSLGLRSDLIAMANVGCSKCGGTGLLLDSEKVCPCVDRNVFRVCLDRFRCAALAEARTSTIQLDVEAGTSGPRNGRTYGRRNEEFVADVWLVARRTLTPLEWKLFSWHFLLGADWKMCSRRLGLEREKGSFFHLVYAIEARLGRVFRELRPPIRSIRLISTSHGPALAPSCLRARHRSRRVGKLSPSADAGCANMAPWFPHSRSAVPKTVSALSLHDRCRDGICMVCKCHPKKDRLQDEGCRLP